MVRLSQLFRETQLQPVDAAAASASPGGGKIVRASIFVWSPGQGNTVTVSTGFHSVKTANIELVRGAGGPAPITAAVFGFATSGGLLELDANNATLQVGTSTILWWALGDA